MEKSSLELFLQIMSDFINKKETKINPSNNYNFSEVCDLSVVNNVSGILYYQLKDNKIDKHNLNKLYRAFLIDCSDSLKKETETTTLNKILNDSGVIHVFLKGAFIKKVYPIPDLRTMGDIDLLVDQTDINKINLLLKKNNYDYDLFNSTSCVFNYRKNGVLFEIHTALIHNNFKENINLVSFFSDAFDHIYKIEDCEYALNLEYNFIYLISHLAKHYYSEGAGIRMFMDVALFMKEYGNSLDIEHIKKTSKNLNIYDFLCFVNTLCNKWFETDQIFSKYNINDNFKEEIEEYILNGGIFGKNSEDFYSNVLISFSNNNLCTSRLKRIIEYAFPADSYMRDWCKWYKRLPRLFLPVSWVYRFIVFIFIRKENIFLRLKKIMINSSKVENRYVFLKKSGFN